jgi:hypothetical protein
VWPGHLRVMLLADSKAQVAQVLTGKTKLAGRALTRILAMPRTFQ